MSSTDRRHSKRTTVRTLRYLGGASDSDSEGDGARNQGSRGRARTRSRRGSAHRSSASPDNNNRYCSMKDFEKLTKIISELVVDVKSLRATSGHSVVNNAQAIGDGATGRGTAGGVTMAAGDSAIAINTDKIDKLEALINGQIVNDVARMNTNFDGLLKEFVKLNASITKSNIAPSVPGTDAAASDAGTEAVGTSPSAVASPSNHPSRTIAPPASMLQPNYATQPQSRQPHQHPPRMQNMPHRQNYNDDYLNKVKDFKANCILVFKLTETYDDHRQYDVDRDHVTQILSDLDLEHLDSSFVEITRLGTRDPLKIRPLRIQFRTNWVRERVINSAWMLRHSIFYSRPNYPEGIFLNRDLTKEDRIVEKNMYMQRKQQRIAARGNNNNDTSNHRGPTTDAQQQSRMAAEHRPATE